MYWIELYNNNYTDEQKKQLLQIVVNNSKELLLKRVSVREYRFPFSLKTFGTDDDPKLIESIKHLSDHEADVVHREKDTFYRYNLTQLPLSLFTPNNLFTYPTTSSDSHEVFYGFEDPAFYDSEKKVCQIITHESLIAVDFNEQIISLIASLGFELIKEA